MTSDYDEAGLRKIAERLLRDASDRDDAIQEMWLASLQTRGDGVKSVGWRVKTLRHRAMRIWNSRQRQFEQEATADMASISPEPDAELDRQSLRELLLETLAQLPERQAEVLRARFYEDLSTEEIADRLNRPAGTIRAWLSRGIGEMRRRLDQRTGDPRLTALALIRGFDWPPETARLLQATGAAASLATGFAWSVWTAGLLAAAAVGLWLFRSTEGESSIAPTPSGATIASSAVASAGVTIAKLAPSGSSQDGQRIPVPEVQGVDPPSRGAPADEPSTRPDGSLRVTLTFVDDAGVPVPGVGAHVSVPPGRPRSEVATSGPDGTLLLHAHANQRLVYNDDVAAGNGLESAATREDTIKIKLSHPDAARLPDINIPFVPDTEKAIELTLDLRPARIRGRILDRQGRPIEGARFGVFGLPRDQHDGYLLEWLAHRSTTDARGEFVLVNVRAGPGTYLAEADGFVEQRIQQHSERGETADLEIVLDRALRVVGVVEDHRGYPVEGARVLADSLKQRPEAWALTGPDGSFELERLSPGKQRLWAYGPFGTELESQRAALEIELTGSTVVWNPVLAPGDPLRVKVLDADGHPLADQRLVFMASGSLSDRNWWNIAVTDQRGVAEVDYPPEEVRVELRPRAASGAGLAGPLSIRALDGLRPSTLPYVLQLEERDLDLGTISGRIVDARGEPIAESCQLSLRNSHMALPMVVEHERGQFRILDVPPGPYRLSLCSSLGGSAFLECAVEHDQLLDLGTWILPATGQLIIENRWPGLDGQGQPYRFVLAGIFDLEAQDGAVVHTRSTQPIEGAFDWLPGLNVAHVYSGSRLVQNVTFRVRSGESTTLELSPGR